MQRFLTTWRSDPRRPWLVAVGLAALTVAVFAPAFDCGWVNYDDHDYVTENAHVSEGLSAANVGWAFTTYHNANWHPLTWLSLQLDASLWGLKAGGYHLTNVIVHALNAALLFLALRALTGAFWRSAAVALLFAVHPLRTESVAWVSERKDVLSAFFGLLALWAYAAYVRQHSAGRYLAVALALVASLMCKPMLVTLPFLMLVLDWWPLGRAGIGRYRREYEPAADVPETGTGPTFQNGVTKSSRAKNSRRVAIRAKAAAVDAVALDPLAQSAPNASDSDRSTPTVARAWRQLALEKLPFVALVALSAVITFRAQSAGGAVGDLKKFPLVVRLENAAVSYVGYLSKTAWPTRLSPFYPHLGEDLSAWQAAGSILLLAVLTGAAVVLRRRAPYLLAGWLWYLGTLLPVIGLVQVGNQGMADRYTYFPQIGILVALCWGTADLVRDRAWHRALTVATTAAVLTLAFLTFRQVRIWHDSVALWENALLATGGNASDLLNLGGACEEEGYWEDAKKCYQDILRRDDIRKTNVEVARALMNLGNLFSEQGNQDEALRFIDAALERDSGLALARTNRGNVLYRLGRFEEAAKEHEEALRIQPELKGAAYNLGLAKARLGDDAGAAKCYEKALALKPDFAEAHSMLGNVLIKLGDTSQGFSHLQAAVRHDPKYVDGHINLGKGLAARGDMETAAKEFEQAIRLVEQEKLPEQVNRLKASLAMAWANLGAARANQRRAEEAVDCMIKAVETDPGESKYREALSNYVDYLKKNEGQDSFRRIEERLRRLEGVKSAPPPEAVPAATR